MQLNLLVAMSLTSSNLLAPAPRDERREGFIAWTWDEAASQFYFELDALD